MNCLEYNLYTNQPFVAFAAILPDSHTFDGNTCKLQCYKINKITMRWFIFTVLEKRKHPKIWFIFNVSVWRAGRMPLCESTAREVHGQTAAQQEVQDRSHRSLPLHGDMHINLFLNHDSQVSSLQAYKWIRLRLPNLQTAVVTAAHASISAAAALWFNLSAPQMSQGKNSPTHLHFHFGCLGKSALSMWKVGK